MTTKFDSYVGLRISSIQKNELKKIAEANLTSISLICKLVINKYLEGKLNDS
jgi:hypothetical protein